MRAAGEPALRGIVLFAATGAWVGYVPLAPGTVGSVLGLPLVPLLDRLRHLDPGTYLLVLGLSVVGAMWVCGRAEGLLGERDSPRIVLDEIVGIVLALAYVDLSWERVVAGFALFRLLDILKPFPAGFFNRRAGGPAVVLDDVVAAAYTNLALQVTAGWI